MPDISSSTSAPSPSVRLRDLVDEIRLRRKERRVRADALRELELGRIDVDRDRSRRAGGARDRNRHQADRADAGDHDALGADAGGHHGVDGVAERIEDGGPLVGNAGSSRQTLYSGIAM